MDNSKCQTLNTVFFDTWNEEHEVRYVSLQICHYKVEEKIHHLGRNQNNKFVVFNVYFMLLFTLEYLNYLTLKNKRN